MPGVHPNPRICICCCKLKQTMTKCGFSQCGSRRVCASSLSVAVSQAHGDQTMVWSLKESPKVINCLTHLAFGDVFLDNWRVIIIFILGSAFLFSICLGKLVLWPQLPVKQSTGGPDSPKACPQHAAIEPYWRCSS